MKTTYHIPIQYSITPRRGDLLQSNVGDKRERTWIILHVHRLPTRFCKEMDCVTDRFKIWAERWWEIEPDTRMQLYRSAMRSGAQLCHHMTRFKPKKKAKRLEDFRALP